MQQMPSGNGKSVQESKTRYNRFVCPGGAGKAVSVMESRLAKFVKERNEALFSLDRPTIEAYLKKRGMGVPENDIVFWAAVYKCIYNITDAPAELKEKAIAWLQAHGMRGEVTCYCPR